LYPGIKKKEDPFIYLSGKGKSKSGEKIMIGFKEFTWKKCTNKVFKKFGSMYVTMFRENLLQDKALTFSCFNYTDDMNDVPTKETKGLNPLCHKILCNLACFTLISKVARYATYKKTESVDQLSKVRQLKNVERRHSRGDSFGPVNRSQNRPRNLMQSAMRNIDDGSQRGGGRGQQQQQEQDEDVDMSDENVEDVISKFVTTLNGNSERGRSQRGRNEGENPRIDPQDIDFGNVSEEFLYVTKINGFYLFVIPLKREELTYSVLSNEFSELMSEGYEDFLEGLGKGNFETAYKAILRHVSDIDISYGNHKIQTPVDMFHPMLLLNMLGHMQDNEKIAKFFFSGEDDAENPSEVMNSLKKYGSINYFKIPGESYRIPLSEFEVESLGSRLLPFIDEDVIPFFTTVPNSGDYGAFSKVFMEKIRKLLPQKSIIQKNDPIDYLAYYVKNLREQNGIISMDKGKVLVKILAYILENKKLVGRLSNYMRSLCSMINYKKRTYGKIAIIGDFEADDDEFEEHPVSSFLAYITPFLEDHYTVPSCYSGWVALQTLVLNNRYNRKVRNYLHWLLTGEHEVGKSYLLDVISELVIPGTARDIQSFSRQGFKTDRPQTGGIVIRNEVSNHLVEHESKLKGKEKERLSEEKEILSSGTATYQYFSWEKDEHGENNTRGQKLCVTKIELCQMMTTNKRSNGGSAIASRMAIKPILKEMSVDGLSDMIKREARKTIPIKSPRMVCMEINMLSAILNIAVSTGIIPDATMKYAGEIFRLSLKEVEQYDVEKSSSRRNFKRGYIHMRQLCYASVILRRYFNKKDDVSIFNYEDILSMAEDMYVKKEEILISASAMSEQYIDILKLMSVKSVLSKFTPLKIGDFQLNEDELQEIRDDIQIKYDNAMIQQRRSQPIKIRKVVLKTPRNNHFIKKKPILRTPPSPSISTISSGSSTFSSSSDNSVRKTKKRKKISRDSLKSIVVRPFVSKKRRRRISYGLNGLTKEYEIQFEIVLRRLHKILLLSTRKNITLFMTHHYANKQSVNLNYVAVVRNDFKPKVIDQIYYNMKVYPAYEEITSLFETMEKAKHVIPIYFGEITIQEYAVLKAAYRTYNDVRALTNLRELFRPPNAAERFKIKVKEPLMKFVKKDKTNANTIIFLSTFLFRHCDRMILTQSVKNSIETADTESARYLVPAVAGDVVDEDGNELSDLKWIEVNPNKTKKFIKFNNPAYFEKDMEKRRLRAECIIKKKENSAKTKKFNNIFSDLVDIEYSDEYDDLVGSMIKERRIIYIKKDFNDFMKEKREEELRCLMDIELLDNEDMI